MNINYTDFPALAWVACDDQSLEGSPKFDSYRSQEAAFLKRSIALPSIFDSIASYNSIKDKFSSYTHQNFLISESLKQKIQNKERLCKFWQSNYLRDERAASSGIVIVDVKRKIHYVYIIWTVEETKDLTGEEGNYFAVELFHGDRCMGFEEAIILTRGGITIAPSGHYRLGKGKEMGEYISFVFAVLGYVKSKGVSVPVNNEINQTREMIYFADYYRSAGTILGKEFYHANPNPSISSHTCLLNRILFDVVFYSDALSEKEIKDWEDNQMIKSYFDYVEGIPFFVLDFGSWSIKTPINLRSMASNQDIEEWLKETANVVSIYIVDATTNIILTERMICIKTSDLRECKKVLKEQLSLYSNGLQVLEKIYQIVEKRNNELILASIMN